MCNKISVFLPTRLFHELSIPTVFYCTLSSLLTLFCHYFLLGLVSVGPGVTAPWFSSVGVNRSSMLLFDFSDFHCLTPGLQRFLHFTRWEGGYFGLIVVNLFYIYIYIYQSTDLCSSWFRIFLL